MHNVFFNHWSRSSFIIRIASEDRLNSCRTCMMQLNSCRTLRPISYSPTAGQRTAVSFIYFPLNFSSARFVLRELRDFRSLSPIGFCILCQGGTLWRAHNMSGILLRRCVGELSNFLNKDYPSNSLKTAIKEVHKERIVCLQCLAHLLSVYMALFCFGVCHSLWVFLGN